MDDFTPWGMAQKQYLFLMHLSTLAGFIIPFGGLILPIVMWLSNKEHSKEIDEHGKVIVNWVISAAIYGLICFVLTFVLIGVLGYIILSICVVAFAIIGAIKANEGVLWRYPLSMTFIK
jgi:uncharacterized Tic20 family protein